MKLLATFDRHILAYWDTAPSERFWAYLTTFVPVMALTSSLMSEFIGG